jgi:ubiquinone biosynthesis protein COQ9
MDDHARPRDFDDQEIDDHEIIGAAMRTAASMGWDRCSLSDIAAAAGIDVAALTRVHVDKVAILRALATHIDTESLAGVDPDGEPDIPIRERVLEMFMLRFDAMTPYKAGITSVARAALANPRLALQGWPALARAMRATLAAAGISTGGPVGMIRIKAMALIFLDAFRVWTDDDSPDLSQTMRRLDERLSQAESLALALRIARPGRVV